MMRNEKDAVDFLHGRQILTRGDQRQFVKHVVVTNVDLTSVLPMCKRGADIGTIGWEIGTSDKLGRME